MARSSEYPSLGACRMLVLSEYSTFSTAQMSSSSPAPKMSHQGDFEAAEHRSLPTRQEAEISERGHIFPALEAVRSERCRCEHLHNPRFFGTPWLAAGATTSIAPNHRGCCTGTTDDFGRIEVTPPGQLRCDRVRGASAAFESLALVPELLLAKQLFEERKGIAVFGPIPRRGQMDRCLVGRPWF